MKLLFVVYIIIILLLHNIVISMCEQQAQLPLLLPRPLSSLEENQQSNNNYVLIKGIDELLEFVKSEIECELMIEKLTSSDREAIEQFQDAVIHSFEIEQQREKREYWYTFLWNVATRSICMFITWILLVFIWNLITITFKCKHLQLK